MKKTEENFELIKMAFFLLCLIIALFVIPKAENAKKKIWDTIPILETEEMPKSEVHGVSVGQNDEVSVDFDDGTVFLYDKNGSFLIGYKFPDIRSYSYDVTLNKDNDLINHYLSKGTKVFVYNREGQLVSKEEVPYENKRDYYEINPLTRTDSNGAIYERKKTNILKIYPDGRKEIFFKGYRSYRAEIGVAVAAVLLFGAAYVWNKNLLPKDIVAELKKMFPFL